MSEYHKRVRRGSVNKQGRFPPPQAGPPGSIKSGGNGHRPPLFELRQSSNKENKAPSSSGAAGGGGSMGLLIPMLGREDDGPRRGGGGSGTKPQPTSLFGDGPNDDYDEMPPPGGLRRSPKRDSISSVTSGMSICFDDTESATFPEPNEDAPPAPPQSRLETVHERQSPRNSDEVARSVPMPPQMPMTQPPRGGAPLKPSMAPRPSRSVPSIPPRLGGGGMGSVGAGGSGGIGSPPKVSLSRRPVRVAGFKRRDITPPAPLFDAPGTAAQPQPPHGQQHPYRCDPHQGGFRGSDLAAEDDGDFMRRGSGGSIGGSDRGPGFAPPASPAKALRLSSFSSRGPAAPGLSSLFGDETEETSSPPIGGTESPRKLAFSLASSTPRASPKQTPDPYGTGMGNAEGGRGARGMFQSPHWSSAVHINPFSPVPTEYLDGSSRVDEDDRLQDVAASSWAPQSGSASNSFYSARGSPLGRGQAGSADDGGASASPSDRATSAAAASANRRKTPKKHLRLQQSDPPLPFLDGVEDSMDSSAHRFYGRRPKIESAPPVPTLGARREADDLAVDTSMESQDSEGSTVRHCPKISPTDVMSFPPPPTPAKKTISRPMPDFDSAGSPLQHNLSGSPVPNAPQSSYKERRPPPLHRVGPGRSFDLDEDLDDMISPRPMKGHRSHGSDGSDPFGLVRSPLPQCSAVSRFEQDFQVVGQLGTGSFGTVHKVISRLDGCLYAVKVMKRPVRGELDRRQTLKEVHALAALCSQSDASAFHIVRYHQAWMEDNLLHIQTELCTSTLPHEMAAGMLIDEDRRFKLLRELLLALELIHKNEMVHLDIKPENIFIKNDQFKLGDFGLASKLTSSSGDVEEGDSRYMSRELLSGDTSDITKCDIFSLGATMYEVCLGRSLPADGPEWADIRSGKLCVLRRTHPALIEMIRDMMHPEPSKRPCASALLRRRHLLSDEQKLLLLEQNRAKEASLALMAQEEKLKSMDGGGRGGKLLGKKLTRSTSCSLY